MALAPLRARLAQLERPAPLTEKQRRMQTLQYEQQETRRRLDRAYLLPEEVRTSGKADVFVIPAVGCGIWFLSVGITIVPLIWRPLRRRARVRRLEAERDEIAPNLQARLNEIESELARLTRS